jgi:hypothetical protein
VLSDLASARPFALVSYTCVFDKADGLSIFPVEVVTFRRNVVPA